MHTLRFRSFFSYYRPRKEHIFIVSSILLLVKAVKNIKPTFLNYSLKACRVSLFLQNFWPLRSMPCYYPAVGQYDYTLQECYLQTWFKRRRYDIIF